MNGGLLDLLATLGAAALVAVVAFRVGVWWTIRKHRTYSRSWTAHLRSGIAGARPQPASFTPRAKRLPCEHSPQFPGAAPGWRHDCFECGARHIAREFGPLDIRWERLPDSSSVADGVPGDNPAGVSISPTTVPPEGANLHVETPRPSDQLRRNVQAAMDVFPQSRGR